MTPVLLGYENTQCLKLCQIFHTVKLLASTAVHHFLRRRPRGLRVFGLLCSPRTHPECTRRDLKHASVSWFFTPPGKALHQRWQLTLVFLASTPQLDTSPVSCPKATEMYIRNRKQESNSHRSALKQRPNNSTKPTSDSTPNALESEKFPGSYFSAIYQQPSTAAKLHTTSSWVNASD